MEGTVQHLDPETVLVESDANARYNLGLDIETRQLADSIVETGGIEHPVDVEKLSAEDKKKSKKQVRLIAGFRRFAALSVVNAKGAGLKLPAIVHEPMDAQERLKLQLRENVMRRNLSPMDKAVAMQRLIDAGVPKVDIAKLFSAPAGRKGLVLQPVSNAHINMLTSFLKYPKKIQERIADGRIHVSAAYELSRLDPAKWEDVLNRVERDRLKLIDKEEADQTNLDKAEAKAKEEAEAQEKAAVEMDHAKAEVEIQEKALQAKKDEMLKAYSKANDKEVKKDKAQHQAAKEALGAVEADAKGIEKVYNEAKAKLQKLVDAQEKLAKAAEEKRKKLEEKRAAAVAAAGTAKTTSEDVKAAAKAEGVEIQKKLTAAEIRAYVKTLTEPGTPKKVLAIGKAFQDAIDGGMTDKELFKALCTITGETPKSRPTAA
jgi:hypothetical protein